MTVLPTDSDSTLQTKYFLEGHEGYLSTSQASALEEFRLLAKDAGLYSPADPAEGRLASHADATLLRFLRARSWAPPKALQQFAAYCNWFKTNDVDNLFRNFDVEEFEVGKRCYPMWIGRRDKMGYPIHIFRLAALDSKRVAALNALPLEVRYRRIVALYEVMMRGAAPLSSMLPSASHPTPIVCATNIVDLENVPFSLVWNLRNHLQQASVLANANYPETMGTTWVINAPSFFSIVWGWLKSWFDENTRRKIRVLSSAQTDQLLEQIDADDLPKTYGGNLDWTYDEPPNLDEPSKAVFQDFGGQVPRGPWEFVNGVPKLAKDVQGHRDPVISIISPSTTSSAQ